MRSGAVGASSCSNATDRSYTWALSRSTGPTGGSSATALPWVLALALIGEAVGAEWETVRKDFEYVDYAIVALIVIAVVALIVRRRRGRAKPAVGTSD
jgi:hypothetical protein